ncbi:hypothetical protein CI1B_45440 [Bradyrhizobium ivorense]|uniref:Uncharacterized protein n=1 Tax=Bradyrhizobium ivorense TaxID=2511166 RepID=A0A508TBP7_9BRAD|nr:hypothetical protein [Bradyrhizobium ivorense]VIO72895.1 hypothetical protein CI1B_45440 [Bradyrhizobium ivorense]
MTVRLAVLLIPLIVTATIDANVLGFAATMLTIGVIVGFAIAAAGWTIGSDTSSLPSVRPRSVDRKRLHK